MDFSGKVVARQAASPSRDAVTYESETLTVFPKTQQARTESTTRTVSGDRVMVTQGLQVDAEKSAGTNQSRYRNRAARKRSQQGLIKRMAMTNLLTQTTDTGQQVQLPCCSRCWQPVLAHAEKADRKEKVTINAIDGDADHAKGSIGSKIGGDHPGYAAHRGRQRHRTDLGG